MVEAQAVRKYLYGTRWFLQWRAVLSCDGDIDADRLLAVPRSRRGSRGQALKESYGVVVTLERRECWFKGGRLEGQGHIKVNALVGWSRWMGQSQREDAEVCECLKHAVSGRRGKVCEKPNAVVDGQVRQVLGGLLKGCNHSRCDAIS